MNFKPFSNFLTLILLFTSLISSAQVNFTAPELLGRPTNNSVTLNLIADQAIQVKVEYGVNSGVYTNETSIFSSVADEAIEMIIDGLNANTRYYYRVNYSSDRGSTWLNRDEHSFITQRSPGSTFIIISDSHLGQYGGQTADELALYEQTIDYIKQDNPDFYFDLSDTFAMDPSPLGTGMTLEEVDTAYLIQRLNASALLRFVTQFHLFFIIGSHENKVIIKKYDS